MRIDRCAAVAVLALTAACAAVPTVDVPQPVHVQPFSGGQPGEVLPGGWQPWILSRHKRPTEYRLTDDQGHTVVQARADASASGLVHPLALDPQAHPQLSWRWKVDKLIAGADNTQRHLEDSPVRLVVSFAGDMKRLPLQDRMFFDNVRLLTGQQLPYAMLMYIWENRAPVDSVINNRHTSRIRMIVAASGSDRVGSWQEISRNLLEDYRRAFGEEPGRITAIGIMTDTDNTGGRAQAWYGDIAFGKLPAEPVIAER